MHSFKQQQMLVGTNVLAASYAVIGAAGASRGNTLALLSSNGWLCAGVVAHGSLQYVGLFFYLLLLQHHSPRTAVTYATVRKAATVLIAMCLQPGLKFDGVYRSRLLAVGGFVATFPIGPVCAKRKGSTEYPSIVPNKRIRIDCFENKPLFPWLLLKHGIPPNQFLCLRVFALLFSDEEVVVGKKEFGELSPLLPLFTTLWWRFDETILILILNLLMK